jgi:hypothetical protein
MVLLRKQSKQTVRDTLDHIQRWHAPDALNVRDLSPITQIYDLLKSRREEPPSRQFLRFKFTHNSARDLLLPEVLRNPEVYNAHPEPDTAAAIMVSTSFDPQLASRLLNYTQVAKTLDVAKATSDTLGDCSCRQCFTQLAPSDLSSLGHVCTYDTTNLRWPYLSSITKAGKKLRLPATIDSVTKELDAGIDHYLTWATEKYQGGEKHAKLSRWAEKLRQLAILNWQQSQSRSPTSTDGYPGLRQAINEAQRHLVFLHDDRAPHGIYMACRRWYEKEMAVYLEDSSVFEAVHEDWDTISSKIKEKLNTFGFPMGPAIVYNYRIWKPKKGKFRYIAGSRKPDPPAEPDTPQRSPANASPAHPGPPRSPGYFLSKALVAALKHVMQSLRDNDDIRQRDTGLRCFWVFESVGEYARFVRTHATQIASSGLQTYDFTTMYTSFDQSTLVSNVMQAIAEAQHFEASKSPPNSQPPTLTTSGWDTTGIGWSLNDLQEMISFSVSIAYTTNGGITRRQRLGVPMGLPEDPQLVNLAVTSSSGTTSSPTNLPAWQAATSTTSSAPACAHRRSPHTGWSTRPPPPTPRTWSIWESTPGSSTTASEQHCSIGSRTTPSTSSGTRNTTPRPHSPSSEESSSGVSARRRTCALTCRTSRRASATSSATPSGAPTPTPLSPQSGLVSSTANGPQATSARRR